VTIVTAFFFCSTQSHLILSAFGIYRKKTFPFSLGFNIKINRSDVMLDFCVIVNFTSTAGTITDYE